MAANTGIVLQKRRGKVQKMIFGTIDRESVFKYYLTTNRGEELITLSKTTKDWNSISINWFHITWKGGYNSLSENSTIPLN